MTAYEIIVPFVLLGLGGLGVAYAHYMQWRLEKEIAKEQVRPRKR